MEEIKSKKYSFIGGGIITIFGKTKRIDESKINLATSLSAVGPTFFLPAIKALKEFAIAKGMSPGEPLKLLRIQFPGQQN